MPSNAEKTAAIKEANEAGHPTAADKPWWERASHQPVEETPAEPPPEVEGQRPKAKPALEGDRVSEQETEHHSTHNRPGQAHRR